MTNYSAHVFICTQVKEGQESCGAKGASKLRDDLKKMSKDEARGWNDLVRINNSGCLGKCSEGIASVIYPKGEWLTKLTCDDVNKVAVAIDNILES